MIYGDQFLFQVKPKPGKSTAAKKFHSQYYVNGTECDLTGKARETQIKVFIWTAPKSKAIGNVC